ncbi:YozE family protein [Peribacillus simplex]|uniref:YozE family protein n=1 Tax=Peribacillus simplex TaxID=1478 RepID=UPI003D27080C
MRPFYLYLMKFRQPKEIDAITKFANYAYEDHGFPKQSTDYNELSSYLELNADYLESMSVFDQAWEQYVQIEEGLLLGDQE